MATLRPRRGSSAPKDAAEATPKKKRTNPFKQIVTVFKAIRGIDPTITWWVLGAFVAVLAVFVLVGVLINHWIYLTIIGLPMALLAAVFTLSRRGERAAFAQMEGKVGATVGALSTMRRGWYYTEEPIAADVARPTEIANAAVVFRALGKPGVVLIGEGPMPRAKKLIDKEIKKVNRVAPGVPVHTLYVGEGEGQIGARKLTRTLAKLKPVLTKDEMANVNRRLKSLPGVRQGIPAGIDPAKARMDRRALRGR